MRWLLQLSGAERRSPLRAWRPNRAGLPAGRSRAAPAAGAALAGAGMDPQTYNWPECKLLQQSKQPGHPKPQQPRRKSKRARTSTKKAGFAYEGTGDPEPETAGHQQPVRARLPRRTLRLPCKPASR